MMSSRLFRAAVVLGIAGGAAIVACGGDSKSNPDAKVFLDSSNGSGSGSGSGSNNGSGSILGRHCTPGQGSAQPAQGDCPAGWFCMNLMGGHDTWCSKTCAQGSGDTCNQGYTGPGEGACGLTVGAPNPKYCMVICSLTLNGSNACSNCTGACPGALTCSSSLMFGSGVNAMGSACD